MPVFKYEGQKKSGETVKGIFSAQDALHLMATHAFTVPDHQVE